MALKNDQKLVNQIPTPDYTILGKPINHLGKPVSKCCVIKSESTHKNKKPTRKLKRRQKYGSREGSKYANRISTPDITIWGKSISKFCVIKSKSTGKYKIKKLKGM